MDNLPTNDATTTSLNPPLDQLERRAKRIHHAMEHLWMPGTVAELRVPNATPTEGSDYTTTMAGYFDNLDDLVVAATLWSGRAPGVYWTINPINPAFLSVAKNRVIKARTGAVKDADILRRQHLLIDVDPYRHPKDISATDAEKSHARGVLGNTVHHLTTLGWPEPALMDSGNGYYAIYRIDEPTDDGGLVERVLKALDQLFTTPGAKIDTSVFNPARIAKVIGTKACKGENDKESGRPHRNSKIISAPGSLMVVPTALLEQLATSWSPQVNPTQSPPHIRATHNTNAIDRARAYLKALPPSVSGQNGHKALYKAAMVCLDGFGLPKDVALDVLADYNHREDGDPETEEQLRHKINDAATKVAKNGGPTCNLLDQSTDSAESIDEDDTANIPVNNPKRIALMTLTNTYNHSENRTLHYWCGEWWTWQNAAYTIVEPDGIEDAITRVAEKSFERDLMDKLAAHHARIAAQAAAAKQSGRPISSVENPPQLLPVTRSLVANVLGSLRALARLDHVQAQPAWLGDEPAPFPPGCVLPTRSALVHLETGNTIPPTPKFFSPYALEFDYQPDAPAPAEWLKFLDSIWGADSEAIGTLQEWLGYCLTPDTSQHKILLLVGPPRSGKGVIARVLRRLIGVENTVGPTLASLAESFGLEPLIGKPLAIIGDARLSAKSDRSVVTERLLSISGEDTLSCNRKNNSYWTGKLPTRLVLLTNETPWLTDSSRALAGRFLALHMTESFEGREDRALETRLAAELPGILNWAIEGWKNLQARGQFVQPESGRVMVEELKELSSRVSTFLADACEVDPGYQEAIPHVYIAWCHWCNEQGESNPGSKRALAKELRTVLPKLSSDKSTKCDNKTVKLFTGLRLTPEYRACVKSLGHTPITQHYLPLPSSEPSQPVASSPPTQDDIDSLLDSLNV